jgi:hypothetical protein
MQPVQAKFDEMKGVSLWARYLLTRITPLSSYGFGLPKLMPVSSIVIQNHWEPRSPWRRAH